MEHAAVLVTIGNELLSGLTVDTNSAFLARGLASIGLKVRMKLSAADSIPEIVHALHLAEQQGTVILLSGGLGPTSDDCTKPALAERYGRPLIFYPHVMEAVQAHFRRLGRTMPEINRNQALLPERSTLLPNAFGTAWGIWIEEGGKHIIALPGVPFELKPMFTEQVLPRLQQKLPPSPLLSRTLHIFGMGESAIAERIADIERSLPPAISLAYLPHYSVVRLRLTGSSPDADALRNQMHEAEQNLLHRLGDAVFGFDDTSLEAELGKALRAAGKSIAVAESCTGGALAARIVSVAGASDYFPGSIVAYANEVKQHLLDVPADLIGQYGAVSEAVVQAMLNGLLQRIPADYGAAISGIAGPDGGTAEKPVGTVWIATGSRANRQARRFQFRGNRNDVIEYAVMNALGLLLQQVRAGS
ncbi:MAG: competence/damage-inducible protein A [Chitinophagales bacterium]|nr:competence/damage-inducible protein A [Chitinophagales bacterium]